MSYDPPIADILDTLENVIGLSALLDQADFAELDGSLARDVLQGGADFVREHIAPHAAEMDTEGCAFDNGRVTLPRAFSGIWQAYVDGGWLSLAIPRAHGGHGLPHLIQAAFSEMVCGASVPVSMLPLLVRGAAKVLARYGDDQTKAEYLPKLVGGRLAATISITEPGAGSDVALLKTKARQQSDGSWRLNGSKMFISFGDHQLAEGILHMTLARIDGAPGSLGLFAVPAFNDQRRDDSVTPQRIEHKLGLMASPTCVMQYDDAIGVPMGGPQDGLKAIFTMINMMRLEVAVQGVGLSGAATQAACSYADMRLQGSRGGTTAPIAQHPDVIRNLLTMRAVTDAARVLVYEAAKQLDLAESGRDPAVRERAARMAAFLLPVCKAGCAETAVDVTNLAIQVHGGHGYIRDTGVERLYRDARILPVYEGTTGIQAIDLLLRKLNGGGFDDFLERVEAELAQADNTAPLSLIVEMRDAVGVCKACAAHLRLLVGIDRDSALAAATPFIRLVYRLGLGWAWLQLISRSKVEIDHRRLCASFYAEQILPEFGLLSRQIMASAAGWARGRTDVLPARA
jgi:alkylation response protein AidB-like acyl-CoA dehydrogenase